MLTTGSRLSRQICTALAGQAQGAAALQLVAVRGAKRMSAKDRQALEQAGEAAAAEVTRSAPGPSSSLPDHASQQPSGGANMGEFDEKGYYGEKEAPNAPPKQTSNVPDGSGVRTTEKMVESVKETLSESWETLKHGVNNAGQPQMKDEAARLRKD